MSLLTLYQFIRHFVVLAGKIATPNMKVDRLGLRKSGTENNRSRITKKPQRMFITDHNTGSSIVSKIYLKENPHCSNRQASWRIFHSIGSVSQRKPLSVSNHYRLCNAYLLSILILLMQWLPVWTLDILPASLPGRPVLLQVALQTESVSSKTAQFIAPILPRKTLIEEH